MITSVVTTPPSIPQSITDEAFAKEKKLKELGDEKARINDDQRIILLWFAADELRPKSLGYENLWEMIRNPDIASALWGHDIIGIATLNRLVRLVEAQIKVPELDVFKSIKRSTTSTPAFGLIEKEIDQLPPIDSPDRPEAIKKLDEKITEIGNNSYRGNKKEVATNARSNYKFDVKHKTINDKNGNPLLTFDIIDPKTIKALSLILRAEWDSITLDEDSLTAWVNNVPVRLAQVNTQNKTHLNAIADLLHASRRF
jgi:hypothetical protein